MLKKLRLVRYKGFKNFSVSFGGNALLMGPNNAGKSTIIHALRLANAATRVAQRVGASDLFEVEGRRVRGWPLGGSMLDSFNLENVRYEFEDRDSKIELTFSSGAVLTVYWPVDSRPFFWITHEGADVVTAARAKQCTTRIGIVPTLAPVERDERTLGGDHLRANIETGLSSRHFRNNLRAAKRESDAKFAQLEEFILENTPELASFTLEDGWRDGAVIDMFYLDRTSRVPKQIYWAGDGLQIWIQILFHLWRTRHFETVVLDEPDVFLHADLQRRLVRVLEGTDRQMILSSHAAEVASEANEKSIVWIQRELGHARKITTDSHLHDLSGTLGTAFNLGLAKALKARVALFVEGHDMKILNIIAKKCGAINIAAETGIATIPINGFSHWPSVEAFGWIKNQFLGANVELYLLLDRDYRTADACVEIEARLLSVGISAHIWQRKEIESYLIDPRTVSKLSGLSEAECRSDLEAITDAMHANVSGQLSKAYLDEKPAHVDTATALAQATTRLMESWSSLDDRLRICPPKDVISAWNKSAATRGCKQIDSRGLARTLAVGDIPPEMSRFLLDIEALLT